jgi:ABC-2 type transport system permease protein
MKSVRSFWKASRKYWAIARITCVNQLTYKVDLATELLSLIFVFSILFFLHRATAGMRPSNPVEQLSLAQTMWIIFFANLFAEGRTKGVTHTLNDEILSGQIAYQLNRPYSFITFHFAQDIGSKLPSLVFGGLTTGVFIYFLVGFPPLSVGALVLGAVMLCIGMVISFLILFCIGLCAFWIGTTDPLRWIYNQIMMVAGGAAVPLALFPNLIKKVLMVLPFSNIIYGAARIIVGCRQSDLYLYLGLQIFWLCMMMVITKFIFKRGIKNVVICGG